MNVSRNFAVVGAVYLIIGVLLGMYMGGSGDHTLAPVHAHINLLGFTLMLVFALVYRSVPAMAAGSLPQAHFWLHLVGSIVLLVLLFALFTGRISEDSGLMMIAPMAELAVLLGVLTFAWNLYRNFR